MGNYCPISLEIPWADFASLRRESLWAPECVDLLPKALEMTSFPANLWEGAGAHGLNAFVIAISLIGRMTNSFADPQQSAPQFIISTLCLLRI